VFLGVLVIDGNEASARYLAHSLKQKGYGVRICTTARTGFDKACEMMPDCIVCAIDLPDIDGLWVCRRIRMESSDVARTPILFLSDGSDKALRVQALHVGGDAVLDRPVMNEEIVAQVTALVSIARRFKRERDDTPTSTRFAATFRGDLGNFPLSSILMMLEMERRTGTLEVVAKSGKHGVLTLAVGLFVAAEIGNKEAPPVDVLREMLTWRSGRFAFRPCDPAGLPPARGSIGAIVLEAMRLEDEGRNVAG